MTVRRDCKNRGISVSYSSSNAAGWRISRNPNNPGRVCTKSRELLSALKLPGQAGLIRWQFLHSEVLERDEHSRFPTVPRATQLLWMLVYRLKYEVGQKLAEMGIRRPCERYGITIYNSTRRERTSRKTDDAGRACKTREGPARRLTVVEGN